MASLFEYAKNYGDSTFFDLPFNEVDAAILSSVAYVDLNNIVPSEKIEVPLSSALENFLDNKDLKKYIKLGFLQKDIVKMVRIIKDKIRYRNIILSNYVYDVTFDKQFCAITMKLPTKEKLIVYEGTDHNLVGWEEDFQMLYKFPVPADKDAVSYINKHVSFFDNKVIVLGHSKGGHLAMSAAMFAKWHVKMKIKKVYNFDGPGFRYNEINSKRFLQMQKKLEYIVPNYSLFGLLLRHPDNIRTIKSSRNDILAHSVFTWEVRETYFLYEPLSRISKNIDKSIIMWLEQHDDIQREHIVRDVFEYLRKSGVTKIMDMTKLKVIINLIKNIDDLDDSTKNLLGHFVKYNVEYHVHNRKDEIEIH